MIPQGLPAEWINGGLTWHDETIPRVHLVPLIIKTSVCKQTSRGLFYLKNSMNFQTWLLIGWQLAASQSEVKFEHFLN